MEIQERIASNCLTSSKGPLLENEEKQRHVGEGKRRKEARKFLNSGS